MLRSTASAFALSLLLLPVALRAQQTSAPMPAAFGTIRGTVFDSLGRGALAGATVELASPARMVVTDQRGNFTLDSVPLGAHRLVFSAPDLDSIGLFSFARDLEIHAGVQQVRLATPSFATMYRTLCAPTKEVAKDSAIMFGTVYDARTRQPVRGATVSFAWYAVDVTSGPQLMELLRQSTTDDAGNYGRCGLPADLALRTHAASSTAASGPVSNVIGSTRVFRRDLYISDEFINEPARNSRADAAPAPPRGSGVVRGTVRDEKGGALLNALVVLLASDRTARTDSLGRYFFAGVPLGTQELSVRQVGRGALFRTVDVAGDTPLDASFTLPQAMVLATVNVRGQRRIGSDQAEFANRQRIGFGVYLDQEEILKRFDMPSALQRIVGLTVRRTMGGLVIENTRYSCQPLIVIDGVPGGHSSRGPTIPIPGQSPDAEMASLPEMRIDALNNRDVVAVEYYANVAGMPMQYVIGEAPRCGMLLIWTIFARW